MAFGGALRANGATVVLTAETGEFNAKIEAAQRVWNETTGQMSKDALRVSIASDRLNKALATTGAHSIQTRRATLAYRDAQESAALSANRHSKNLKEEEGLLNRVSRGAISGSGAFRGMGRSIAFASSTFLGGAGLVYALRSTISAARDAQVTEKELARAVQAQGLSWKANREQIDRTLNSQSRVSSFYKDDLAQSFTLAVRNTKNVSEALRLNAIAADVARGRNIGLSQAMIILIRAQAGQIGSLRRLGIEIAKGTSGTQALAEVQRRYAGAAATFTNSAAGAQAHFNNTLRQSEVIIGTALLPTISRLLQEGAKWLDSMNKSGKLQKDVNTVVKDAGQIMHGFGDAIHYARIVLGPLVSGLGGLKRTAEIALIGGMAFYALKAAAAVRALAASFALVGPAAVRAATVTTAAEAEMAAGATAARGGLIGGLLRGLGGLAGAGTLVGAVAVGDVAAVLSSRGGSEQHGNRQARFPHVYAAVTAASQGRASAAELRILRSLGSYSLNTAPDALMARAEQMLGRIMPTGSGSAAMDPRKGGRGYRRPRGTAPTSHPLAHAVTTGAFLNPQDAYLQALTTPGTADDISTGLALEGSYQSQIDALLAVRNRSAKQEKDLEKLYRELHSVQSHLDSISRAGTRSLATQARKRAQAERKAVAAKKKRETEARKQMQQNIDVKELKVENNLRRAELTGTLAAVEAATKAEIRFYQQLEHNMSLTEKAREHYYTKELEARKRLLDEQKKARVTGARPSTSWHALGRMPRLHGKGGVTHAGSKADAQLAVLDILQQLTGVIGQFGSNISEGPAARQTATHMHVQTEILREQTRHIRALSLGQWHPGAAESRLNLSVAGIGAGF